MIVTSVFVILIGAVAVDAAIQNVALGKPTYMSSKHYKWGPERAVDGNNNARNINTCFHTKSASVNWWYVDLKENYPVRLIELFNRLDCSERASNVELWVGTSLSNLTKVKSWKGQLPDYAWYVFPESTPARFVKLVQKNNTYFHLCEVKVYAQW